MSPWQPSCKAYVVKHNKQSVTAKNQKLSIQIGRDITFFIFNQNSVECMTSLLICIF